MIFGIQKNLRWYQIALMPVALPLLAVGLAPFAVLAAAKLARDWLRDRA